MIVDVVVLFFKVSILSFKILFFKKKGINFKIFFNHANYTFLISAVTCFLHMRDTSMGFCVKVALGTDRFSVGSIFSLYVLLNKYNEHT